MRTSHFEAFSWSNRKQQSRTTRNEKNWSKPDTTLDKALQIEGGTSIWEDNGLQISTIQSKEKISYLTQLIDL